MDLSAARRFEMILSMTTGTFFAVSWTKISTVLVSFATEMTIYIRNTYWLKRFGVGPVG